jgi:hypothetical protein
LRILSSSLIDSLFQLQVNNISSTGLPNENLRWGAYDAITTEPIELKQMALDVESTFLRQLFLYLDKATIGEIYYFATTGAN